MENLNIEATEYTPKIILDAQNNLIDIRGDSFPENTFDFYKPVTKWLKQYFDEGNKNVVINIEINYFNSSSSQLFFDVFDMFEAASEKQNSLEINWIYSAKNESAQEAGEDFVDEFESLNINLIEQ